MHNLLDDLSTLTTIGKYNLDSLAKMSVAIISHDIEEALRSHDSVVCVDIGIGELRITNIEDKISYKFIPSTRLDNAVKSTYENRESKLTLTVDEALGNHILKTYKDLF